MEKLGSSTLITIDFFDLNSLELMGGSDPIRVANPDEAFEEMGAIVESLLEVIGSGKPANPGGTVTWSATYRYFVRQK